MTKLAATVILTRGPAENPEVYLARRAPELNFFGGYWVFPGGNVSKVDYHEEGDPEELVLKRCAIREILEETDVLSATLGEGIQPGAEAGVKEADKGGARTMAAFPGAV